MTNANYYHDFNLHNTTPCSVYASVGVQTKDLYGMILLCYVAILHCNVLWSKNNI